MDPSDLDFGLLFGLSKGNIWAPFRSVLSACLSVRRLTPLRALCVVPVRLLVGRTICQKYGYKFLCNAT